MIAEKTMLVELGEYQPRGSGQNLPLASLCMACLMDDAYDTLVTQLNYFVPNIAANRRDYIDLGF